MRGGDVNGRVICHAVDARVRVDVLVKCDLEDGRATVPDKSSDISLTLHDTNPQQLLTEK